MCFYTEIDRLNVESVSDLGTSSLLKGGPREQR